ncbi:MAG: carbohydrate ABC transporter permease [Clostridia bacterium]|nr:carbohydrate ABC transporter permease [Clostridia bacterium]
MRNPNKIKRIKSERITFGVYYVLFTLVAIMYLYPIVSTFFNSLKSDIDLIKNPTGLPTEWWRINNYLKVFSEFRVQITTVEVNYFGMLWNSLWMTGLKLFVNLASSVLLAYPIAKFKFPGKNFLYGVVIFVNTIPILGSGAAGYKLLKSLNMLDNPYLIWISWCGGFDYAFIIFYGTFKGISDSYIESASLDGANNLTIMFKIMLPQALPSIVALAITQAIPMWNDYSTSMIQMPKYPNLAYGIFKFEPGPYVQYDTAVYYCAVIISMLPPMILYAANQKFILSSLSVGGLKG